MTPPDAPGGSPDTTPAAEECGEWVPFKKGKKGKPDRPAHPCKKIPEYPTPAGPRCVYHAAKHDPQALARQMGNFSGGGARKVRVPKLPTDPAQAVQARIRELQRLAAAAERRRDLDLAARFHGQINELITPQLRASADATTGTAAPAPDAPATRVHIRSVLSHLSDAELETLKALAVVFDRAVELARLGAPAPAVAPMPERPIQIVTVAEEKK